MKHGFLVWKGDTWTWRAAPLASGLAATVVGRDFRG